MTATETERWGYSMDRYRTQKEACLAYLEEHDSITPLEALHEFRCFRLAAVIARLREDGHIIRTDIHEGEPRYAVYTLMKEGVEYDG